jgi:hypothetical protein
MEQNNDKRIEELRSQYGENVELRTAEVRAAGDDTLVVEAMPATSMLSTI